MGLGGQWGGKIVLPALTQSSVAHPDHKKNHAQNNCGSHKPGPPVMGPDLLEIATGISEADITVWIRLLHVNHTMTQIRKDDRLNVESQKQGKLDPWAGIDMLDED